MRHRVFFGRVLILVAFLLGWQLLSTSGLVDSFIFPSIAQVLSTFPSMLGQHDRLIPGGLSAHMMLSLQEIAISFGVCAILGVSTGFAIGSKKFLRYVYEPLLYLFYSIPSIIIYPVIYLVFTVGIFSKIVFAIIIGVFPVIFNTISGFSQINPENVKISRSMGAGGGQMFLKVILPSVAPSIMAGLRLGLSYVIVGVLAGEVLASTGGLGWVISSAAFNFNYPDMYAIILLIFGLAYLLTELVRLAERLLFPFEFL